MRNRQAGWWQALGVMLVLAGCGGQDAGAPAQPVPAAPAPTTRDAGEATGARLADPHVVVPDGPLLSARRARVRAALAGDGMLQREGLDPDAARAQQLALGRTEFIADQRGPNGEPLLTEVLAVYPLRPSENAGVRESCVGKRCYRVEKYNYARNVAQVAFVDIEGAGQVLGIQNLVHAQPDVTPELADLAREIASRAPEVRAALGYAPDQADALMAATKTALNRSRCERSRHLCVAPTFVLGERALWAIVDLTELKLVGVRWTEVGHAVASTWTEKKLQNEVLTRQYCEQSHTLERDGWRLDYVLTTSDGLKISDVRFQGRPVLKDAKLVDWHVNYSGTEGFGYSDAIGCPVFSQAAVLAVEPPEVAEAADGKGFELRQGYWSDGWPAPCNYNYEQRYEFGADGSFRVVVASLGRGCGDDGTYRPVTRIAFAEPQPVQRFTATEGWQALATEGWWLQPQETLSADGAMLRLGAERGWELVPSTGQFGDGGRGDQAYVYLTREHPDRDEGSGDLITIGPCCNTDHRQGPERFIEDPPEPLAGAAPVVWYVAQLKNAGPPGTPYCWADTVAQDGDFVERVWPCPSGPLFRPFGDTAAGSGHGTP